MSNRRKGRQNTKPNPDINPSARQISGSQKSQQPSTARTFYWRDHPIVIAALAAVGTFTVTSYTFKELIIPTQVAGLPALRERAEKLEDDNSKQAAEISHLRKRVETYQYQALFKAKDPFPIALNSIKLGDLVSDLESDFPGAKIEKTDTYWSADFGYGVVNRGTYFYDQKSRKITHVLFWLSTEIKLSGSFLQDRLEESLGKPSLNPTGEFFQWKVSGYNVYKSDSNRFVIHDSKSRPGYWPEG